LDQVIRIGVQWLHVTAGVLWIGGGFYTIFVQLPALAAMPQAARGPAMAAFAPRQVRYLLRVAEATLGLGILNLIVSGRAQQLTEPLGSRWAIVILIGILLAIALYGIVRGAVKPLVDRLLAAGARAATGDQGAAAEMGTLLPRIKRLGYIQLVIGVAIILAMVTARFS
jgi:hypothetical protein